MTGDTERLRAQLLRLGRALELADGIALRWQEVAEEADPAMEALAAEGFAVGGHIEEAITATWRAVERLGLTKTVTKEASRIGRPPIVPNEGTCIKRDCAGVVKARGLCEMHYCRWKRGDRLER